MEGIGRGRSLFSVYNKLNTANDRESKRIICEDVTDILTLKQKAFSEVQYNADVFQDEQEESWDAPNTVQHSKNNVCYERAQERHLRFDSQGSLDSETKCICNRNRERITCYNCGHNFFGRIRKICELHKNIIHLMDDLNCSKCGALL